VEIRNLTPHEIAIHTLQGIQVIPPSGMVARVRTKRLMRESLPLGSMCRVPVSEIESLAVDGLPEPEESVMLLVSTFVAQHPSVRGRADVASPDLHSAIRDHNGNVVAVSTFVRYS
jgi:hypothetical protein